MIVRESISFEKRKDPKTSLNLGEEAARQHLFDKLEKEGANFFFYGTQEEMEEQKKLMLENIFEIEQVLKKCKGIIPISEINTHGAYVEYKPKDLYKIVYASHVLFPCATEEDANFLVEIMSNLIVDNYKKERFKVEFEQSSLSFSHMSGEQLIRNVDDILRFRKKYEKEIKNAPKVKQKDIWD